MFDQNVFPMTRFQMEVMAKHILKDRHHNLLIPYEVGEDKAATRGAPMLSHQEALGVACAGCGKNRNVPYFLPR